ncbi:MAG: hypothetical protein HUJ63_04465, partial [Enterococcus sp.]|nr:hypothetical protein [Enterococcus sp.]
PVDASHMYVAAAGTRAVSNGPEMAHPPALESARGVAASTDFKINRTLAVSAFSSSYETDTYRGLHLMSLYGCQVIPRNDVMALEANAQSVPYALAAFDDVPVVEGSPINSGNAYEVFHEMGLARAKALHPEMVDAKRGVVSGVGTNMTLDVRAVVEEMVDVVGRFVAYSSKHRGLPIFSFLHEAPDAKAYTFSPDEFGAASFGLTRLSGSVPTATGDLADRFSELYLRVVEGRELDGDAFDGSSYVTATGYDTKWKMGFTLSVANLTAMKNYAERAMKLSGRRSRGADPVTSRLNAAASGVLERLGIGGPSVKSAVDGATAGERTGSDRNLIDAIDELISVFRALEERFGRGFAVEPSAV